MFNSKPIFACEIDFLHVRILIPRLEIWPVTEDNANMTLILSATFVDVLLHSEITYFTDYLFITFLCNFI